ncbi:MAG: iron complex outerrane recepter protein [Verrucomicrobiota bacterium]
MSSTLLLSSSAFGVDPSPSPVNNQPAAEVERLIITGSNIPTADEVGPNPVDSYRRDDLTNLGVRTPTDFIQVVPSVAGFGPNEYNDASTRISLRGIAPKDTLLLEDGRRIANNGLDGFAPDFNQFPLGLIDHIDVLKDGASPVYGTDAMTGVVNVFLIHRFPGVELYSSYGNTNLGSANDMGQEIGYLLAGTGDDKTNIVVYAGYFNQAGIFGRDIDITSTADYTKRGGIDLRTPFFAGHVGGFLYQRALNGGAQTPTPHAYPNVASDPEYVPLQSVSRQHQLYDFSPNTAVVAPTDRQYLYGSFDRDICAKFLTVFADFKYFRQFWDNTRPATPFLPDVWTDATHPFGISGFKLSVPIQNAFNPFTVPDYVSPGGFNPAFPNSQASAAPAGTRFTTNVFYQGLEVPQTDKISTDNRAFTGGLRGTLAGLTNVADLFKTWQWEAAVRWNEDYREDRIGGAVNNNALRAALLDSNPATAFNPFGLNQNSQYVIDRVFRTISQAGYVSLLTGDFALNGDLMNLPAGPASFAVGTSYLTNKISGEPDRLTASGQVTTGAALFGPVHGDRNSWSLYWELRVPIISPTWNIPGFHSLEFDYAERFEDYSDFGTTERPKFSLRWQPLGGSPVPITLRASYIEAFHAPTLSDLYNTGFQFYGFVFDPMLNSAYQTQVHFSGNPQLQPEFGYQHTFGGVLTPETWWHALQGLTISVDYGHLDVRGFQTILGPEFIVEHESDYPGFVVRAPSLGNRITLVNSPELNVGRFIQSYIDYEVTETFETARLGHGDWGRITATFNGTYLADVKIQPFPGAPFTNVVGKFGGGFMGQNGGGNFTHNRWYASLFYDGRRTSWLGGFDAGGTVHYVGQYWDVPGFESDSSNRKVREWVTLDLLVSYTFHPQRSTLADVPGLADGDSKQIKNSEGKDGNVMPLSTAEYNLSTWQGWLKNTTITVGLNNVTDQQPPFVAGAPTNGLAGPTVGGYDTTTASPKGRFWYLALTKRF